MESSRLDYGQFTQDKTIPQFISCNLFSLCLTAFMLPGVLLALTVLAFLFRRSRLKAAAASGEDSGKQCKGVHHKAITTSDSHRSRDQVKGRNRRERAMQSAPSLKEGKSRDLVLALVGGSGRNHWG